MSDHDAGKDGSGGTACSLRTVVVVTAEPEGAYHLAPFSSAARRLAGQVRFVHLVPSASAVPPALGEVSDDPSILASADRLVVCGGGLSAWPDAMLSRLPSGRPVVFGEVAFLPRDPTRVIDGFEGEGGAGVGRVVAASAQSSGGAEILRAMFPSARVHVTGAAVAPREVVSGRWFRRVLLLSRPGAPFSGGASELAGLYRLLVAGGFSPRVRCHPSEDAGLWEGFLLDRSGSLADAALGCFAVCGYPGTALSLLAAAGYPAVALMPDGAPDLEVPAHMSDAVPTVAADASGAFGLLLGRPVAPAEVRARALAQAGSDAATRTVRLWAGLPDD